MSHKICSGKQDHFRGCLLGGAIGDALGWPVEFMRVTDIESRYGDGGISELVQNNDGKAEVTDDTQMTFFSAECAALTHGHPSGYLPAGALAYIIALIIEGSEINNAIGGALSELKKHRGSEECVELIQKAIDLNNGDVKPTDAVPKLGGSWTGEEAIAISLYCALTNKDSFGEALIASVNHDGDSDSTGSITGNILGAYLGCKEIPKRWVEQVELSDVVMRTADDLMTGYKEGRE